MKEFKLAAWPDLPAPYKRTGYRRMLSDMSHRYVTLQQLVSSSGASRVEVKAFIDMLASRGLLSEREIPAASLLGSLRPLGGWLRRAIAGGN